jgi:thiol-disulfide isomerase/thioredoxin
MKRHTHHRRRFCSFVALITVLAFVLAAGACASKSKPAGTPTPPAATAPPSSVGQLVSPPSAPAGPVSVKAVPAAAAQPIPGPPPLTGIVTRAAIESFNDVWKGLRAQDYEPEAAAVSTIREHAKDVEVVAVVATWCPDTRRDLPRFFKIADQAGWPIENMKFLAVDRTKKDAGGLTEKWNVTRVPTFIFIRGGQEIGRVVERPTTTLEKDIAGIVSRR